MSDHPIVHVEFSARNLQAAGEFYHQLFGWNIQSIPEMHYVTYEADPGPRGGFAEVDGNMYKAGDVIIYVATDDIEASLAKAEALGGKIVAHKTEIPGVGWFGFFTDPTGNRIGLHTRLQR